MKHLIDFVTVWTVQPSDFDISQPGLDYDHKRGWYWQAAIEFPNLNGYRTALSALHRHFEAKEILWCFSDPIGWYRSSTVDQILWELELPISTILAHFDSELWSQVVAGKKQLELTALSLPCEYPIKKKCEVLVRWPLPIDCRLIRLGSIKADTVTPIDADFLNLLRESQ